MEDALYEIASMRQFARLSMDKAIPDRTTIMNFRHLLEQHKLARKIFSTDNHWLVECGVLMTQGTHSGRCHDNSSTQFHQNQRQQPRRRHASGQER